MKRMKTLIKNILLAVPVILSASCSDWQPDSLVSSDRCFYRQLR